MGSVQNVHLPMIRPFVPVDAVSNSELQQAQENAQLLWSMINAPVLSYELIPDLTEMLSNSQQMIIVMISEGTHSESVMVQAFAVNDVVNQVLEDAQCIANGTKRRYQEEIDVANLMKKQDSNENKSDDDDEVSLEHSISIENGDENNALFALTAPTTTSKGGKPMKKKHSKRQSIDLLGMSDNAMHINNGNAIQKTQTQNKESEENIL